jgi:hypothetical protein
MVEDLDLRHRYVAASTIKEALDPIASRRLEGLLTTLETCPPTLEALLDARARLASWRSLMRELGSTAAHLQDE